MNKTRTGGVLRQLQRIVTPEQEDARGDAQLLDRFARARDEMAFELLVWRHRRLVMGVCRRVLGDYHDAEDAFQATFLTLARKASSISQRECLATWLYRVSYRIALHARGRRRLTQTVDLTTIPSTHDSLQETDQHDLRMFLDDEVSRLPAAYQAAIVLCYLQGKTYREASIQLGLPLGTVSAHLSRARAMLRDALARRGVVISAAALASALCGQAAVEAKSAALVDRTVQAVLVGSQESIPAAVLSQGVMRAMAIAKLKSVGVLTVAVVLVATVMGTAAYNFAPATDRPSNEQAAVPVVATAHRADEKKEDRKPTPQSLAERYRALVAAWKADTARWSKQLEAAKTAEERKAVKPPDSNEWAKKKWALVAESPNDPAVLEILCSIAVYHCWDDDAPLALDRLHRDFLKDPRLGSVCNEFTKSPDASAEKFLRAVKAENPDPAIQARAALALAFYLRWHALQQHGRCRRVEVPNLPKGQNSWALRQFPLDQEEEVRLLKEVESICKDTIAKHAKEEWVAFPTTLEEIDHPPKTTMGKEAQRILDSLDEIDIRRLAVGQIAKETFFTDINGKELKLSECRGKVVFLSFGKAGCGANLIPFQRGLVTRMTNRPFVLIGIDGLGPDPRQDKEDSRRDWLKQYAAKEQITWTFCGSCSAKSGNLFQDWNIQGCPTLYLIDDRGVIRHRFEGSPGEEVLNTTIDGLVREAEERVASEKEKKK